MIFALLKILAAAEVHGSMPTFNPGLIKPLQVTFLNCYTKIMTPSETHQTETYLSKLSKTSHNERV